jgi:hypothetical protein
MATRRGSEESQAHAPVAALRPPRVIQTSRRRSDALVIDGSRPFAGIMLIITGVLRLLIIALDLFVIWALTA